jgi:hypothetical protein
LWRLSQQLLHTTGALRIERYFGRRTRAEDLKLPAPAQLTVAAAATPSGLAAVGYLLLMIDGALA